MNQNAADDQTSHLSELSGEVRKRKQPTFQLITRDGLHNIKVAWSCQKLFSNQTLLVM